VERTQIAGSHLATKHASRLRVLRAAKIGHSGAENYRRPQNMLARDVTLTNSKYVDGMWLESGPEQKVS